MQARKKAARGVVAPRQNNRIRHQGEQGSEKKSEEGDTRNKQKTTKQKGSGKRRLARRKGKTKKKKEQGEKARMSGRHYANYSGLNRGDAS